MVQYKLTSRDIEISPSMEDVVEMEVGRLDDFEKNIIHCDVVLSQPHCHRTKRRIHHVHLHIKTRNDDIYVDRETEQDVSHADFRIAVGDAFASALRTLKGNVERMRDRKKRGAHVQMSPSKDSDGDEYSEE